MDDVEIQPQAMLRTMINDGESIRPITTIEYKGKFWLVPHWYESRDGQWRVPVRIIGLETFPVQDMRGHHAEYHFAIHAIIPKALLDGLAPPELAAQYEVVELPHVRIRTEPIRH